jgi:hypothetical protein
MLGDLKRMYRGLRLKSADGNMNAEEPYEPKPILASTLQVKDELLKTFTDSLNFLQECYGDLGAEQTVVTNKRIKTGI